MRRLTFLLILWGIWICLGDGAFAEGFGNGASRVGINRPCAACFPCFSGSGPDGSDFISPVDTVDEADRPFIVMARTGLVHHFSFFNLPWVRRWHVLSLRNELNMAGWPLVGVINYGRLMGAPEPGLSAANWQFQLEAYPRLSPGDYVHLLAAYSESRLFPHHHYGGEWFHSFGHGLEASAGMRWMEWGPSIWFYTGSLAKYTGNYWFSFRPYITRQNGNTGQTYSLAARRYGATPQNYLGVKLLYGTSPEYLSYVVDYPDIKTLKGYGGYLSFQQSWNHWIVKTVVGYRREEFSTDRFRGHFTSQLHLLYQLNR